MAKSKKLLPWVICAPLPQMPDLTSDLRSRIADAAAKAGFNLSANDWENIEVARRDYLWTRSAKRRAITYESFAKRLRLIREGADSILHGLSGAEPNKTGNSIKYNLDCTTVLLTQELAGHADSASSSFELIRILHSLRQAAARAEHRTAHWGSHDAWRNDWHVFVSFLATIFENHSVKPTAAKSSRARNPEPSPFVRFVWNIMHTLPREAREHVQSLEAMADAIANSLAFSRKETLRGQLNAKAGLFPPPPRQ